VSSGGRALGRIDVERGAVLYAALEDNPRRLQTRLRAVLDGADTPDDLHITTSLPRLPELGAFLAGWLDANPGARLIIVDVLRKVRPLGDGRGNMYNEDYDSMGALKALADKYGIAVVAVHHTRKMADDSDVFNEVSGSTGLTGAADAILIAKRSRNTAEAVLHVTGRDINEQEHGLIWHPERCAWTLSDEPVVFSTMGDTRRQILEHIRGHEGDSPAEVSQAVSLQAPTVRQTMRRMVDDNQLSTDGEGRYFLPLSLSHLSPLSHRPEGSDTCDTSDSDYIDEVS
jgi:RecA-family ATPase